jgi:hypothetical protein
MQDCNLKKAETITICSSRSMEKEDATPLAALVGEVPPTVAVDEEYPESGWAAWFTVTGAFLALLCTFGQLSSFGIFQSWYSDHQLSHLPPSTISWIGALQLWTFFFSVCSRLYIVTSQNNDFAT